MMLSYLLSMLLSYFLVMVFILIGVAFFTLLERKILGYIQIRKGPNKVGILGLFQPFSDAVKLFCKESIFPMKSNYLIYYCCPIFSFLLVFMLWSVIPFLYLLIDFGFGILFLLVFLSFNVYSIMIGGWSSNSNYSLLGGLRGVAQSISYEVSLAFIFINLLMMNKSYNLIEFYLNQENVWYIFCSLPLFSMMILSMLAETNRSPFDFAEGESELVSGFNVEYSSGLFALIFLSEYAMIIFSSFLITLMFFGGKMNLYFFVLNIFYCFVFIWVRGSLPRYRYDKLMNLCWKMFLPSSLFFLGFYFGLKSLLMLF